MCVSRIPLVDPIVSWWGELPWRWRWEVVLAFWPPSRVPYRSSAGADSQRMSHCSPALRPLPVPVGLRDKQKQSQTLWGGGWTCSPPPDPAATPQAGRQADRQTDARLGGMGRDTPIFSRFCIPTPFLPWAKNTRAGWTGKIITIKELSRRCVQLFPRLLALPFGQDRSPSPAMDDSTLHPHPSTLHPHPSFPISPHPLSAHRTLPHPCRPAPRLLQGCIPHPLTVPSPMPHQPWGPTPFS